MSIYDKASLVLIPSGTKTSKVYSQKPVNGDGDFTFSRSTAATRVNADGNIEKETQNLALQSNSFNTSPWSLQSSASLTSGQSGYDGTNNAWLLSKAANYSRVEQNIVASGVWTFSCYAKAGTLDWISFENSGIASDTTYFDLSNGTLGSLGYGCIDSAIEDIGSGWYRCSVTISGTSSVMRIQPSISNGVVVGGSGNVYIQDAQLEQGLVARDYIETTTAAVEGGITDNVPRLDYTDSSCPALLLEPQRTNIFRQSEYYNTYWSHTNSSVSNNQLESPEGFVNASILSVVSPAQAGINVFNTWSDNTTYSMSAFVKKKIGSYIGFGVYGNVMGDEWIKWNLDNGTSTANDLWTNANFEDFGNGWYRISATITTTSGSTSKSGFKLNLMTDTSYSSGNVGDEAYIYGAQLEAGSYATSYIPTYGTSVTRNNETLLLGGMSSDVALGATSGTLMVEFDYTQESLGDVIQWYSGNTITGRGYLYNRSLGFADTWGSAGLGTTDGVNTKVIWRLDSLSSGTFFKDGVKGNDVSTTTQAWNNINTLYIRGHYGTLNIRQIIFVPTALSNEEAIDLTTL
jgi:hypothetical protein